MISIFAFSLSLQLRKKTAKFEITNVKKITILFDLHPSIHIYTRTHGRPLTVGHNGMGRTEIL